MTASSKLVIASDNQGKLAEFANLLAPLNVEALAQGSLNISTPEETGLSFVENAILKARHASSASGLAALADDSGIEVAALAGAPGIYSARYAGTNASDADNRSKLLHELNLCNGDNRSARFRCAIAIVRYPNDPSPLLFEGAWNGTISDREQGDNGFGYDPIFYIPELQCTAAQCDKAQKNQLSHRAKAVSLLREHLRQHPTSLDTFW